MPDVTTVWRAPKTSFMPGIPHSGGHLEAERPDPLGQHLCLGSRMATLVTNAAMRHYLRRIADYRLRDRFDFKSDKTGMTPEQYRAIEWDIGRLINVYANLNDLRKWTEVAATYLEDGEMIRPSAPDHPIVGREAILKSLLARPADRCTKHFCANVAVTVLSEREATAYSAYQIYSGACEAENPLPLLDKKPPTICEFHDRLALTPDGWRFRRRQGVVLFRAG